MESSSNAAIWSAIAALFAALSSFLIFRVQRKSLAIGTKPEIVLGQWQRTIDETPDTKRDTVSFRTIKNVGRGTALQVVVNADFDTKKPTHVMNTCSLPTLAPDETFEVQQNISI